MSGENVEDPTPAPVAAPAPEQAPVAPADVVAPHEDAIEPADLVDAEKASGLIAALKATRSEAKQFKERAAQAEQLAAENAQMRAYLAGLQQSPKAPEVPAGSDPELVEIAQLMDYWTRDGKPDLDRAAKHQALTQRQAQRIAQQMVAPIATSAAQQKALANFQQAVSIKGKQGHTADAKTLAQWFQVLGPEYTSDERMPYVLSALNIGMQVLEGNGSPLPPQPAPPGAPPLMTEASGGAARPRAVLSEAERRTIENRGMDEKRYGELTKNYRAGRPTILED